MKRLLLLCVCMLLLLAACSSGGSEDKEHKEHQKSETMQTFTSDNGEKVKIPKHPKRIAVLHPTYVGALIKFGHQPIAVSNYVEQNKVLDDATKGIERIDGSNIEQVAKQKPDLIIATVEDKNAEKLQKIAPTVFFNANKSKYRETTKQLAKLVNEEEKAEQWLKDWDQQMEKDKKELASFIKGKTASVVQQTPKGTMAFSDHYGRGTEVIYGGYGLIQPDKLKAATKDKFATPISPETFGDYVGDIVVVAQQGEATPEFQNTNYWQNLEAVKNHRIITLNVLDTQYNDPISLEKQRDIFYEALKDMQNNEK
ncbi:ABC transporter substrate-binding protein [Staphylococcus sp. 17KM0847]|uniref:ABC transporter substrate-binding protein n=1 Tax=Staphylococcus sp. 17KM0847 TaxID=2583989 RepID=UPI0015DD1021|nr:ABC transporter substrate-binding protein [Staphylococcus sp. 17KM0847]QLK86836.1 ferrichrome ABC transporter substrate-binding protein [Staphylococcus sp. 17KM0847]